MTFACSVCYDLLMIDPTSGGRRPPTPRNNTENRENEVPCMVAKCGHTFHSYCIDRWFETCGALNGVRVRRECPFCRTPLPGDLDLHRLYLDDTVSRAASRTLLTPAPLARSSPALSLLKDDIKAAMSALDRVEAERKIVKANLAILKDRLRIIDTGHRAGNYSRIPNATLAFQLSTERLKGLIFAKKNELFSKGSELLLEKQRCFNLLKALQLFENGLSRLPIPPPTEYVVSASNVAGPPEPVFSIPLDNTSSSVNLNANALETERGPNNGLPSRSTGSRGNNRRGDIRVPHVNLTLPRYLASRRSPRM